MRSSKSRSRSKSNRQRSLGNIVNRVFDSSGPEGKVRGTPQQIIDKYLALARDAQLSNDRVAEQNFLQHAEHYTRMLGDAQRELGQQADTRGGQPGEGGQGYGGHNGGQNGGQNGGHNGNPNGGNGGQNGNSNGGSYAQGGERNQQRPRYDDRAERDGVQAEQSREDEADDGPGLVETPEARAEHGRSAAMMPVLPAPEDGPEIAPRPERASASAPPAEPRGEGRKPRGPRKPREKRGGEGGSEGSKDAAE